MSSLPTVPTGFRLISGNTINTIIGFLTGAAGTFIQTSTASGLTAAGTNQATALALTAGINIIGTAALSTGVVLPSAAKVGVGGSVIVFNNGANPIKVYGAGSDTVDGAAAATGVTLTNAKRCEYIVTAAGAWTSAQLGVASA